jgi:hypothetical protein
MTNHPLVPERRPTLSARSAFVVHLSATDLNVPEALCGRIEHVASGRSSRFASIADLVGFMRRNLDPIRR